MELANSAKTLTGCEIALQGNLSKFVSLDKQIWLLPTSAGSYSEVAVHHQTIFRTNNDGCDSITKCLISCSLHFDALRSVGLGAAVARGETSAPSSRFWQLHKDLHPSMGMKGKEGTCGRLWMQPELQRLLRFEQSFPGISTCADSASPQQRARRPPATGAPLRL